MKGTDLYDKRKAAWRAITIRYIKLVSNSGFAFSLYLALIIGGVYYQRALTVLPPQFPSAFVLTVFFVLVIYPTTIRTYIQRADLIFLLPAESELSSYFEKAFRESWGLQALVVIFAGAVGMPLYLKAIDSRPTHYGVLILLFIILKGWNLYGVWAESRLYATRSYRFLRFVLTVAWVYFLISKGNGIILGLLVLLLAFVSLWVYRPILKNVPLNWIGLSDEEARQAMRLLRLANWVTDVPGLEQPMKPRGYLNGLFRFWPKKTTSVYPLLYLKTFLRAGDYFGLYIRLTLIGALFLILAPSSPVLAFVIFGVCLFLTAFQLLALGRHDFPRGIEGLYPLEAKAKREGFLKIIRLLLITQALILSVVFLIVSPSIKQFLIMLVVGGGGAMLWVQLVSIKKTA
ncbi:MAG TPA: ABC transporter permease [Sporolactobacillaceae bacterium]|nr:ABC transporter permease [Sporolactobacillaceae bacterium]